jgi:hypothetical protein
MKIINLPNKKVASVSVIPTHIEKFNGISTICFRLATTDYSLEEAVSIIGFLGYVHPTKSNFELSERAVRYDNKGRPLPIVAVCFTKNQGDNNES